MSNPHQLPSTRYQGSKAKLLPWMWSVLQSLEFESVLDLFGGTGSVSYWMKVQGKQVTFNDILASNHINGLALIENDRIRLSPKDLEKILKRQPNHSYSRTIERLFQGIFYLDIENRWLDRVVQNISTLTNRYKRALAYRALFQACIRKRPFNLFHRANLAMRTRTVQRSFGNKATWDTPFETHFREFVQEGNLAVFSNTKKHHACCEDALCLEAHADLVYIDTPYLSAKGNGVNYLDFYHFLEGMLDYDRWPDRIDHTKKHKPLRHPKPVWSDPYRIHKAFQQVFERYADAILVVSYRNNGIPSIEALQELMRRVKTKVDVMESDRYSYVLSPEKGTREVLLIGR